MREQKYRKQRQRLIDLLREKGISDEQTLAAIAAVRRHLFIDAALLPRAYRDEALPIGLGQTISQPFTVAYQTQLLDVQPDARILEIGTGSGYQAAVLCEMGARVFTIERLRPLYERTSALLRSLGYQALCRCGDGTRGWESVSPFDGVIVTAGATDIPQDLLKQLRIGGKLIIPVGDRDSQQMKCITRISETEFEHRGLEGFRFVPLIPGS